MVQAAAAVIIDSSERPPRDLLDDLMTPGGITEEGLRVLEEKQAISSWSDALDASLKQALSIDR